MALLWHTEENGTRYEVRTAGKTVRLYSDGVFHSQYNPNKPLTGSVWDRLFIPAFFKSPQSIQRILLLGVGGGAVIHLLRRYVQPKQIVGVELSPIHLHIARNYFHVEAEEVTLHHADAIDWVKQYRGPGFDMVIEDLYGEEDGEPKRAIAATKTWMNRLTRLVNPDGMLVMNFVDALELKQCAWFEHMPLKRRYPFAFSLTGPRDENRVAVFCQQPTSSIWLREQLRAIPPINPDRKGGIAYQIRRL